MEKNDFIKTLQDLRKKGYAYAGIKIKDKTYYICLDNIKNLNNEEIMSFSRSSCNGNKFVIEYIWKNPINTFNEYFTHFKNNYKKYSEECKKCGYDPVDSKEILTKVILEDKASIDGKFYKTIKKTNIIVNGDLIIIDKAYKDLGAFAHKEYQIKDYTFIDYVFNVSKIDMIIPLKEEREITSKECLEVIEEIESSGKVIGTK